MVDRVIPTINIAALFDTDRRSDNVLAETDLAVFEAATTLGFMTITGLPHATDIGASAKHTLTRLFTLPAEAQRSAEAVGEGHAAAVPRVPRARPLASPHPPGAAGRRAEL